MSRDDILVWISMGWFAALLGAATWLYFGA